MDNIDLSKFSDQDLDALERGDLSALSDEGLATLEIMQLPPASKGPSTRGGRRTPNVPLREPPIAERRVLMRPDEYGERMGAGPEIGPSPTEVAQAAKSTGLGIPGGFFRMGAGITSIGGETETSRALKEIEAGLRARAPTKEAYDIAKYTPEVIPAAGVAKVVEKVPMASRLGKQLLQAVTQAATAAAVEPEDRTQAALVAGGVALIPAGVRGVGWLREKFNEALTGGKADIVRDQFARIAEQLGFKIEAGQVSRTSPVATPGAPAVAESNQEMANRWASAPTGESTDKITGTFINDRFEALGKNYDDIFKGRQFNITPADIRTFETIQGLEDSISPAHVPKVKSFVKNILENYDKMSAQVQRTGTTAAVEEGAQVFPFTIAGEGLQRLRTNLRTAASSASDKAAASEINSLIDKIDEMIKNTDPKLYEKLQETNRQYRATSTLRDLSEKEGISAGDVSLEKLGQQVKDDRFNPLFPIGQIGRELGIRAMWEPTITGSMRAATSGAQQLIRPGMARIIFNRIARYPASQAARNLQKKIIDAEATGGLGNLSFSAQELAILNPIVQSLNEEEPVGKQNGGLVASGNIDVSKLPAVRNPDGSYSTVRSMGIEMDGKFYLIPTVINGRVVSDEEAIKSFEKTGKHLGIFGSQADSDAYAERLHQSEAKRIGKAKVGKAKGGAIYSDKEKMLLDRYADGGKVTRPTLPADRSAGYKQESEGDNRLLRFAQSFGTSLPGAVGNVGKGYWDTLSAFNKYLYQLEPEEQVVMLKRLPANVRQMIESGIESAKQIPERVASATPEEAGRFAAQTTAEIALDSFKGRAKPVVQVAGPYSPKPMPKLEVDNPGGDWLEGKKEISNSYGFKESGAPKIYGAVTGYFDDHVYLPVSLLKKIPGENMEQMNVRKKDLEWLKNHMAKNKALPKSEITKTDYAPFITVDQKGRPFMSEGNHRVMAASELGWDWLPVEIRYFNGSESVEGPLSPEKIKELLKNYPSR